MNYIDKLNYILENTNKCHICNGNLLFESYLTIEKKCVNTCIAKSFSFYISKNSEDAFFYKFKVFSPKNNEYITFYFNKKIVDIGGTVLNLKTNTIIELDINDDMLNSLIKIEPPFINEEKIKSYLLFM